MTRPLAALFVAVGLVAAVAAWAETPKFSSVSPYGARRGEPTEVTIFGSNLEGKARLIASFRAEVTPIGADAASWKFRITPEAETPVGVYPCRLRTDDGLSAPFLFAVGQVVQVQEKEDNGSFELAQPIPSPSVVEGKAEGNDVDYFRFPGKKGQRVVVDAQCSRIGSGVDPSIRLTTASRGFVASADDTPGLATDARLSVVLPEDGDYVIELSDSSYKGDGKAIYRLLVGPVPVADEVFPLGGREGETIGLELRGGTLPGPSIAATTLLPDHQSDPGVFRPRVTNHMLGLAGPGEPILDVESMPPLTVGSVPEFREPVGAGAPPLKALAPVVFNGRIGKRGEEDRYIVVVAPGQKYRIAVAAADLGSALDGVLQVKGPDNNILATADDTPAPNQSKAKAAAKKAAALSTPDPSVDFTVPAGLTELTLTLRDLRGEGGDGYPYRLAVRPVDAAPFQVVPVDDQVNIPRGGTAAVAVNVTRQGFAGPIRLDIANPPPGLTIRPGLVNPGQAVGTLTITAAPDAAIELANLRLIGEGLGGPLPIVVAASKTIVFAEQGTLATNVLVQDGLPAATSQPTAITLDTPGQPVVVVHGYAAAAVVRATRSPGTEDVTLAFGSTPLPAGFAIEGSNLAGKAAEGNAAINAAVEAPLGLSVLVLTAKGKLGDKEKTLVVPAVTVEVVRPVSLDLAPPPTEVKAGGMVEIKGTIERRGPFREPVTVKLDGLTAGLKADPVTLPPDQAGFTFKLMAEPTAVVGTATVKVTLAYQVNKKDYPNANDQAARPPISLKVVPAG